MHCELTPEQIATCKCDLLEFTAQAFRARRSAEFVRNWHHETICNALERVVLGHCKRLIINIPPRYSKTELAVINFIAWSMGIFPDSEFITASYSKTLAAKSTYLARALVQSEFYKAVFPDLYLSEDSKAKEEWRTVGGGCVYAAGSQGTITGYGAGKMRDTFGGCIIIDDPLKPGDAASKVVREGVNEWFSETLESRTNSPDTPIILIMQRLHEEDLSGFLLNGGNGEKWDHLCLPALNDGKALWPYKHTAERLEKMEAANPYVFAGQYQQRPAPLGGGIFKTSWWKYYRIYPRLEYRIITADTAQKAKEHNDYSVFQCWGKAEGNAYLLDQVRGKWEAPELRRNFRDFWVKHYGSGSQTTGKLRAAYIEDKVSGTGLIQDMRREGIPVFPIQRNRDKVTRAMDAAPFIEAGFVHLPEGEPWVQSYRGEFEGFTPKMTHEHDDQIDPTLDAIELLLGHSKKTAGTW